MKSSIFEKVMNDEVHVQKVIAKTISFDRVPPVKILTCPTRQ